ncbi:uncharacterized protein K460DRAFT_155222 [Cucurbitaria berberidis CBS 394.84]|uniref:Uncharacterized protein n=1 Tax=Cucurbitaria berberidis CBS 394.84 TaxID=1168544 RepID=A0A9P4L757_9PLEO|nr:uncharacterized protein K460DRAFT_155222 [Cucurbitaria berberidis CBS 394.84]KAF1843967.1 hypothetical protein K460DRAFT_155222 [Cucurbitaria berberidis CBS 394.84]
MAHSNTQQWFASAKPQVAYDYSPSHQVLFVIMLLASAIVCAAVFTHLYSSSRQLPCTSPIPFSSWLLARHTPSRILRSWKGKGALRPRQATGLRHQEYYFCTLLRTLRIHRVLLCLYAYTLPNLLACH